MRSAGKVIAESLILDPTFPEPVISGFTPINRPQDSVKLGKSDEAKSGSANQSAKRVHFKELSELDPKQRKRKTPTAAKPTVSKRPKKTTDRSQKKDISKDLPRTKAGLKTTSCFSTRKTSATSGAAFDTDQQSKPTPDQNQMKFGDHEDGSSTRFADFREVRHEHASSSMAERFHTETNPRTVSNVVDLTSPFTSSTIQQNISSELTPRGDDGQASRFWQRTSLEEFVPPPSAQPPKEDTEEILQSSSHEFDLPSHVNEADVEETDGMEAGEFLIRVLHPHPEQVGAELAENAAIEHNSFDESNHWPDDVSMPDEVIIYDEEMQLSSGLTPTFIEVPNSQPSNALNPTSGNVNRAVRLPEDQSNGSENEYDDAELGTSLVEIESPPRAVKPSTPPTSPLPSSSPKLKWLPPKPFTPSESPVKVRGGSGDIPHLVPTNAEGTHMRFVRSPFPESLQNRSAILELTKKTVLRTCFRIGEALNAAAKASRLKSDAIIELYARVLASSREANGGFKQSFKFGDLFTDRPPYLDGVSTIWKGVNLWDQDSRVFLGENGKGRMCRVVGRIKKGEGQDNSCVMTVLSIWEADWEEVGIAKGVVCS